MKKITTHDGLTFPPPRELDDAEAGALELLFELARDDYARSVLSPCVIRPSGKPSLTYSLKPIALG